MVGKQGLLWDPAYFQGKAVSFTGIISGRELAVGPLLRSSVQVHLDATWWVRHLRPHVEGPIDFVLTPSVSNLEGSPLRRIIWKPPALSLLTHSTRSNSVAIVARICAVGKVPPTNGLMLKKITVSKTFITNFTQKISRSVLHWK